MLEIEYRYKDGSTLRYRYNQPIEDIMVWAKSCYRANSYDMCGYTIRKV